MNVMNQYRPCGRIVGDIRHPHHRELMGGIASGEYIEAIAAARKYGLHRGFFSPPR